jgi:type II secretory pathway pseudopilin PulG
MFKRRRLNQFGDTLIEVLIAATVISLAIGGAYSVANRSLKTARQSQERVEATKIVEGQIEQLKALSQATDDQGIFGGSVFCLTDGLRKPNTGMASIPSLDSDPLTTPNPYANDCKKRELYHIAIQKTGSDEFTVVARWFSIGSSGKEQVSTKYRLYP